MIYGLHRSRTPWQLHQPPLSLDLCLGRYTPVHQSKQTKGQDMITKIQHQISFLLLTFKLGGHSASWIKWCQKYFRWHSLCQEKLSIILSIYTFPVFDNPVNLLLYMFLRIYLYLKIKIAAIYFVRLFSFCTCAMHLVSLNPKQNSTPTVTCKHNNK